MKLARVQFGSSKINEDQLAEVVAANIPFFNGLWVPKLHTDGSLDGWWAPHFIDISKFVLMTDYKVEKVYNPPTVLNSAEAWEALQPRPVPPVNTKINVAIGGLGLLAINDVKVEYDLCTDVLGQLLKKGWRILAICPQPDQRRPDYVLGRSAKGDQDE